MGAMSRSLSLAFSVLLVSLLVVSATDYEYKPEKSSSEKMLTKVIGIQGTILCKTGSQLIPVKDAIARITCVAVDRKGYETAPFSKLSSPANAKGYYFVTLSPAELERGWRLRECKVYLEKSPVKSCNVPSDVNNGKTGATLPSPRLLKTMNLYSILAFVYTPKAPAAAAIPPVPRGY
ncbi:Proline-rich protein 1 [Heracleum sosnowskyi]|uniref:Proline-rich protein 1 n=1 Tax=Heracleum sosnowskyi TaxID=360622 RepID=A0AAD8MU97_9APIA|nr:Proline-rich protein 1 [Heracleum sosnowskyi]